ncbi:MAG: endonuclease III [Acidiferrobacterales bacterium]
MNAGARQQVFERLREANPHPTTELGHDNTFQLLIAVILSAQATDKGVNLATNELFRIVKKPRDILDMGLRTLKSHIKTIGLYNTKAANIMKTCKILEKEYGGRVPNKRDQLEALAGVGRKTANVILNTAFGEPVIAVDTHIFRVSNRIGIAPGKTVRAVENKLMEVVDAKFKNDAHHWLILHGRYTCIARKPRCGSCVIYDLCEYGDKVTE